MSDSFFLPDEMAGDLPWLDNIDVFPASLSAFVCYSDRPTGRKIRFPSDSHRNVNKRMIGFLRKNWTTPAKVECRDVAAEMHRNYKHVMGERIRREKQKRSYMALLQLLPPGTKNDKCSIVQTTIEEIEEMKRQKHKLEVRNGEIEGVLGKGGGGGGIEELGGDNNKIKLRVGHPSSGIDSMMDVLQCLKENGTKATCIHANFSAEELSAVLQIQTKIDAAEVERAVHRTLIEAERKFRSDFPSGWIC